MATVKTAISVQEELFDHAEALAREMNISRSALVSRALEEYIYRHEQRQLSEQLDAAYSEEPDLSEENLRRAMRRKQRRILEGEW